MPPKPQKMIALYLGATKKKPIIVMKQVQDPNRPTVGLPWGEPMELEAPTSGEDEGPGKLMELLLADPAAVGKDYEPPTLADEVEEVLASRRRIIVRLEAFGRLLLFPSSHHPGGGGYGTPREGIHGDKRMSDFELVKLARSL